MSNHDDPLNYYGGLFDNAFADQQQQLLMQNVYGQFAQSVQVQPAQIGVYSAPPKPKPRRDCPCCGAPWAETCDYCGRED